MPNRRAIRPRRGNAGAGRGAGAGGRPGRANRPLGSADCTCPKCGHTVPHQRGVPCSDVNCPKCNTPMKGAYCLQE